MDTGSIVSPPAPPTAPGPRANRTIAKIKDAARQVFLTSGYSGATIDEIATLAGVSRASFYTYFTSRRDVLIAVGETSAREALTHIGSLQQSAASVEQMSLWVHDYFQLLDVHGSFAFAWTQAARDDEEVRVVGMRAHLALCRQMGEELARIGNRPPTDAKVLGLAVNSLLERSWDYATLYDGGIDRLALENQVARMIWNATLPA